MSFSIGSTTFTQWDGPPSFVRQHISVLSKPGGTNISAIGKGVHGDPFEVQTTEFFVSKAAAQTASQAYLALIGAAAQTVTYMGVDYETTYSHKYLVKAVEVADIMVLPAVVGLVTFSPAWTVKARWTLVPISV